MRSEPGTRVEGEISCRWSGSEQNAQEAGVRTPAHEAFRVGGGDEYTREREAPAGFALHEVLYRLRRLRAGVPHLGDDFVPRPVVASSVAADHLVCRLGLLLLAQVRQQRTEEFELAL